MSEEKLSDKVLGQRLAGLPGWQLKGHGDKQVLVRELKFADFAGALKFVNQMGAEAEKAGYHPDIDIRYNQVRLALVTHDAHGITQKDIALAQVVESLVAAELNTVVLG